MFSFASLFHRGDVLNRHALKEAIIFVTLLLFYQIWHTLYERWLSFFPSEGLCQHIIDVIIHFGLLRIYLNKFLLSIIIFLLSCINICIFERIWFLHDLWPLLLLSNRPPILIAIFLPLISLVIFHRLFICFLNNFVDWAFWLFLLLIFVFVSYYTSQKIISVITCIMSSCLQVDGIYCSKNMIKWTVLAKLFHTYHSYCGYYLGSLLVAPSMITVPLIYYISL